MLGIARTMLEESKKLHKAIGPESPMPALLPVIGKVPAPVPAPAPVNTSPSSTSPVIDKSPAPAPAPVDTSPSSTSPVHRNGSPLTMASRNLRRASVALQNAKAAQECRRSEESAKAKRVSLRTDDPSAEIEMHELEEEDDGGYLPPENDLGTADREAETMNVNLEENEDDFTEITGALLMPPPDKNVLKTVQRSEKTDTKKPPVPYKPQRLSASSTASMAPPPPPERVQEHVGLPRQVTKAGYTR